jgi:hypothetical protein
MEARGRAAVLGAGQSRIGAPDLHNRSEVWTWGHAGGVMTPRRVTFSKIDLDQIANS